MSIFMIDFFGLIEHVHLLYSNELGFDNTGLHSLEVLYKGHGPDNRNKGMSKL